MDRPSRLEWRKGEVEEPGRADGRVRSCWRWVGLWSFAVAAMLVGGTGAEAATQTRRHPLMRPAPVPREAPNRPPSGADDAAVGQRSTEQSSRQEDPTRLLARLRALAARQQQEAERAAALEREAQALRDHERALAARRVAIVQALRALAARRAVLALELQETRRRLAALTEQLRRTRLEAARQVTQLVRLRALPPALLMVTGADPEQTVLRMAAGDGRLRITGDILHRLKEERARLAAVEADRQRLIAALRANEAAQEARRQELDAALAQARARRQRLVAKANAARERVAALGRLTRNLEELLRRIQNEMQRKPAQAETGLAFEPPPGTPAFVAAKGRLVPPVLGRLVERFGARGGAGHSRGLTFATEARTVVVAPWDGRVVYAAPFRSLGIVVIIAHGDGYFSLLARLGEVVVAQGQWVLAGEPVGRMPAGDGRDSPPRLYFELRRNARAIDPLPWLAGFGHGRS